jgi:phosphoglucosamine mutase
MRKHFGTDGVRGVVGETLTADLVERLGGAATLWAGGGTVLVGRDTRASGQELEEALGRGVAAAGGKARLAGVLPTPAVALLADGLGAVISASHNPPEYNGVKFFAAGGRKLSDADELAIEHLLGRHGPRGGSVERVDGLDAAYADLVVERFGSDLSGLRLAVDCANGAMAGIAPGVLRRLGAEVTAVADEPNGSNINVGCGATDLTSLAATVRTGDFQLGVAFDGDGDRMLAVDEDGEPVDGDQILAVLALAHRVDRVAVTVMTNLGFPALMAEHDVEVDVTPVGDR